MQTLFSTILPLLAIRLFLNPVLSLSLSSPNPPPLTATAQYSYLNHIPAFSLVFIRRSSSPFRPSAVNTRRKILFILLLSGDVEINPGPHSLVPSLVAHPGSLTKHLLSTLSISGHC